MRTLLLFVCLVLLPGCEPTEPAQTSSRLLVEQGNLQLVLTPATAPVETPLTLALHTRQKIIAIEAEITGVSMYMGKVPLRFTEQSDGNWQAQFLLGACSEPAMQWQLHLTAQYADGNKVSVKQRFTSSW